MVRHLEKRIQQVELDSQEKVSWICSLYLLHWHVYFRPCLRCFVLFCFRFRFNYLGIDNKILDAKFFVQSYNLQHVLFVFLFDSLTSENKCTRTGHEWRTQWGWGGVEDANMKNLFPVAFIKFGFLNKGSQLWKSKTYFSLFTLQLSRLRLQHEEKIKGLMPASLREVNKCTS